jgi:hypothetical protein
VANRGMIRLKLALKGHQIFPSFRIRFDQAVGTLGDLALKLAHLPILLGLTVQMLLRHLDQPSTLLFFASRRYQHQRYDDKSGRDSVQFHGFSSGQSYVEECPATPAATDAL